MSPSEIYIRGGGRRKVKKRSRSRKRQSRKRSRKKRSKSRKRSKKRSRRSRKKRPKKRSRKRQSRNKSRKKRSKKKSKASRKKRSRKKSYAGRGTVKSAMFKVVKGVRRPSARGFYNSGYDFGYIYEDYDNKRSLELRQNKKGSPYWYIHK